MKTQNLDLQKTSLGIEFGSTRIKGILIDSKYRPVAVGEFNWENKYENGLWTYSLEELWEGIQYVFTSISKQIHLKYGKTLSSIGSIGISAMMHGYLPFDKEGNQLTAFRTWRNTNTDEAARKLTNLFKFNIPHRWSIAHLYQAILNKEEHVNEIDHINTLAGYVHWKLTGEKVLGVGDASGVFPIDVSKGNYDETMLNHFNRLVSKESLPWQVEEVLPEIRYAGESAGRLTEEGARLLDPSGNLEVGIPFAPPEGDAGTGMVATNSIRKFSGNISAGTSIFSMTVLNQPLNNYYKEIDVVTTPAGDPVAMVHCNNFTSDINDWLSMFAEMVHLFGLEVGSSTLYETLFKKAMEADADTGGITVCSYYAGEPITNFQEGRPLIVRKPNSNLNVANFMMSHIFSALATLRIGMDILTEKEAIQIDFFNGHGGFFKTENVGQQIMADALKVPVITLETAGEGGAWGASILAAYVVRKQKGESLEDFLDHEVFNLAETNLKQPKEEGVTSFDQYLKRYQAILEVERAAIEHY